VLARADGSDASGLKDDLWFEPDFYSKTADAIDPAAVAFFKDQPGALLPQRGESLMNEIGVAVAAMRAAADAHKAAADALQALSAKLSLSAFDPPIDGEKGTPPPSVGELRIKVGEAVQRHGKDRVKEIIAAEAGGAGIGEMTEDQRLMVAIAMNAADALAVAK